MALTLGWVFCSRKWRNADIADLPTWLVVSASISVGSWFIGGSVVMNIFSCHDNDLCRTNICTNVYIYIYTHKMWESIYLCHMKLYIICIILCGNHFIVTPKSFARSLQPM